MAKLNVNMVSYTLQRTVDLTIVLPSATIPESMGIGGVKASHHLQEKFPVVYLLHGYGNNHAQWTGYTNAEMFAEERRIALVCFGTENKSYSKVGGDDFFSFLEKELPEFVTNYFPISDKPEDTYIAGLSMGGYGTLLHGFSYPEKYHAMGIFSGAPVIEAESFSRMPVGEPVNLNQKAAPDADPYVLAERIHDEGRKFPKIYIACGKKDALYPQDVSLRDHLKNLGADVTWDELPEYGHEWRFWGIELEKFLDWLPRNDYYAGLGRRQI